MCGKKEDEECSQTSIHNTQGYQEQLFLQQIQQQRYNSDFGFGGGRIGGGSGGEGGLFFSQVTSPILPWNNNNINPNPPFNQLPHFSSTDSFNLPPPPPPPPLNLPSSSASTTYGGGEVGGLFNRRGGTLVSANSSTCSALQFAAYYEGGSTSSPHDNHHHHLRSILSEQLGVGVGSLPPFGAHELGKLSAQELMDAKALAASKSHSEAERRRRERINNHLAKLRSLLPSTTKTDKASLLQEVIQHVRELKRQTSQIAETSPVPTETDELVVDDASDMEEDGKFIIKASLCCEDRSDLLPELIKTLKALRLKTLKAEITTLGGRVKNVLFITGEDQDGGLNNSTSHDQQNSISSIQKAFKAIMERTSGEDSSSGSIKRQRTNTINMLQQQQHMTSL